MLRSRKRLHRRTAMKRTALNKVGPRTRRRAKATAHLRRTVDPTFCEVKLEGICTRYGQDWAHSLKSRQIVGEQWEEAARSCRACHTQMDEVMSHAEMYDAVRKAIARRNHGQTDERRTGETS
jgi:hypothetical protein